MAATVSSPWSKPGAWALDAEEHEAELEQQQQRQNNQEQNSQNDAVADFPSLSAAAKQPKKKKNQKNLSLAEFSNYSGTQSQQPQPQPKGLTHDELLSLPTGPRHRSPEELSSGRLGGGFRSYGLSRGADSNDSSSNTRWGSNSNGNGNSRVSSRDSGREFAPSRADEIDDWSKTKKSTVGSSFDRRERGERGSLFSESQSKADEAESWVANKATMESRRFEKRGSFDSLSRGRSELNNNNNNNSNNNNNYGYRNYGVGGGVDSDNWGRKREEGNESGSGVRPKLVLQPRTLPVSESNGTVAKPKGSSPFGDARPREDVLKEKGKDWREIDEKVESLKIDEKEAVEKGEKRDATGWRSFGKDSGNERIERSWRKPDAADSNGSGSQRFV